MNLNLAPVLHYTKVVAYLGLFWGHLQCHAETPQLPEGAIIIEAEKVPGAGDVERSDASARGGYYASNDRTWNPVVSSKIPPAMQSVTVWARVRGGPFQLKGVTPTGQVELKWIYDKPANWTWVNFGTYTRDKIGDEFVIIRGSNISADAGIDTLLLSPTQSFDPTTLETLNKTE